MKMLVYHSLTGKMCEPEDISLIDPRFHGRQASTLSLPLKLGTIASVEGLDKIKCIDDVVDLTVYYEVGHECLPAHLNTLDQLFGRVMIVSENKEKLLSSLLEVRYNVSVKNKNGEEMIIWDTFDTLIEKFRRN